MPRNFVSALLDITPPLDIAIVNSFLSSAGKRRWLDDSLPCASLSSTRGVQGGSNPPPVERACPSLHPGAGLFYPKGGLIVERVCPSGVHRRPTFKAVL